MNMLQFKNSARLPNLFQRASLDAPIYSVSDFSSLGRAAVPQDRAICLTFDDGPDPIYTPKILKVLAGYNVKATFFVLGSAAEEYPQLVDDMAKAGHAIGNHTYSHGHPWVMTGARAKQEVARTTAVIENIIGVAPRWFRPPFGRLRDAMREQAQSENMATVLWSHSIIDWGVLGTQSGISQRLDRIKVGDIVLMHDGKREHNYPEVMLQCLPEFLNSLAQKSLVPITLDDFYYSR